MRSYPHIAPKHFLAARGNLCQFAGQVVEQCKPLGFKEKRQRGAGAVGGIKGRTGPPNDADLQRVRHSRQIREETFIKGRRRFGACPIRDIGPPGVGIAPNSTLIGRSGPVGVRKGGKQAVGTFKTTGRHKRRGGPITGDRVRITDFL